MLKNSLFQPSFSFSFCAAPSCFSVSALSVLFSVSALFWSAPLFCFNPLFLFSFSTPSLFSSPHFFLFFWLPFIFQPKRFSAQTFLLQFSHSSLLLFSALFFSGSALLFLFQRLLLFFFSSCLSFLPLATTYCPFSAQVFSSKPFSAASCLFI